MGNVVKVSLLLEVIRLGRPLFLVGGFVFHGLGIALAGYQGAEIEVSTLVLGQIIITATQLMTHYSNDYFDLAADSANLTPTRWSGGSRVLVEESLPPRAALAAAIICGLVALTVASYLALFVQPAPLTMPLLLLTLFLAWEYSGPPLRLHSRGLGEITVALIVPGLTPLLAFYWQTGQLSWLPVGASLPLACLQAAMIMIIDFPDAAGDKEAGKRTWVVRLGPAAAARVCLALLGLAYVSLPLLAAVGLPWLAVVAMLIPAPAALWLARRLRAGAWGEPAAWNKLGFVAVALLMATAVLETAAFWGLTVMRGVTV
jgi:1,4-dihydroxy-2-naphthoate octaprenyltransferase